MFRIAFLLLSCSVLAGSNATDWPGFRGLRADGHARGSVFQAEGFDLKVAWQQPVGIAYSGVAVADGRVVTMHSDAEHDLAVAFDAGSGKKLWSFEFGPIYKGHDGSDDGPIGTPAIANGRVFALDTYGLLVALDAATGKLLWKHHLIDEYKARKPHYGFGSSPLVVGDKVIVMVGGDNQLFVAFDVASGAIRWGAGSDRVAWQSPALWQYNGEDVVVGAGIKTLMAVRPADGSVVLSYDHGGGSARGAGSMTPVPMGPAELFLTHKDDSSAAVRFAEKHEVAWETRSVRNTYNVPVYHEGHIYAFSSRILTCVDASSGELVWRSREPGDGFISIVDNHLLVATKDGELAVIAASPEGYQEKARIKLFDAPSWSLPAFADGHLFLRGRGGIARVDITDNRERHADTHHQGESKLISNLMVQVQAASDKQAVVETFLASQKSIPVVEGGNQLHFFFRSKARDVVLAGDLFGARKEKPMQRIEGTDLFHLSLELAPDLAFAYQFVEDFTTFTTDPLNKATTQIYILGKEMEFNRSDQPMDVSWFTMPGWKEPAHLQAAPMKFEVKSHEIESKLMEKKTSFDVLLPEGYDANQAYPVTYLLDGDLMERGELARALSKHKDKSKPQIFVVYTPQYHPKAYDALSEEVVPAVDAAYKTIADRSARTLLGVCFTGDTALSVAVDHPQTFARVATISAWIQDNVLRDITEKAAQLKGDNAVSFYIDWGRFDFRSPLEAWDIGRGNQNLVAALKKAGLSVHGKEFNHGTDWPAWRLRTGDLVEALYAD